MRYHREFCIAALLFGCSAMPSASQTPPGTEIPSPFRDVPATPPASAGSGLAKSAGIGRYHELTKADLAFLASLTTRSRCFGVDDASIGTAKDLLCSHSDATPPIKSSDFDTLSSGLSVELFPNRTLPRAKTLPPGTGLKPKVFGGTLDQPGLDSVPAPDWTAHGLDANLTGVLPEPSPSPSPGPGLDEHTKELLTDSAKTTAVASGSLYYFGNQATLEQTSRVLQGLSGNPTLAEKAAPAVLDILRSHPTRYTLLAVMVGSAAVFVYEKVFDHQPAAGEAAADHLRLDRVIDANGVRKVGAN